MILYVNGDSHTAAAEAVNPHAFAEDDPDLQYLGRLPHPSNLLVSWGKRLSETLKCSFKCDAESAASNDRIYRTTLKYAEEHQNHASKLFMVVQWSTWEREEWLHRGTYYQVNASGMDHVPEDLQDRYRHYIANVDWTEKENLWHDQIWDLHQRLDDMHIPHVFFNGNNHFSRVPGDQHRDWGKTYLSPYTSDLTFNQWLLDHGFETVAPKSYHFGKDAHAAWSRFMLQYIVDNKLLTL